MNVSIIVGCKPINKIQNSLYSQSMDRLPLRNYWANRQRFPWSALHKSPRRGLSVLENHKYLLKTKEAFPLWPPQVKADGRHPIIRTAYTTSLLQGIWAPYRGCIYLKTMNSAQPKWVCLYYAKCQVCVIVVNTKVTFLRHAVTFTRLL